ncbi:Ras GTPase activating protein ira2 [Balamuthia mandrillaris]
MVFFAGLKKIQYKQMSETEPKERKSPGRAKDRNQKEEADDDKKVAAAVGDQKEAEKEEKRALSSTSSLVTEEPAEQEVTEATMEPTSSQGGESAADKNDRGDKAGEENKEETLQLTKEQQREADFLRTFVASDFAVLHALYETVTYVDTPTVVNASVKYFMTKGDDSELLLELLKSLIDREISVTKQPSTLFRSNSAACKMLSLAMKLMGKDYLKSVLRWPVNHICEKYALPEDSLEIDPVRMKPGDDAKHNQEKLTLHCHEFLTAILDSIDECPIFFRKIANYLQLGVARKFPESRQIRNNFSAVGGLLFLRFFCPAIFAPEKFGMVKDAPTPTALRTLVLISKVLQTMANGLEAGFEAKTETYMVKMNDFIKENFQSLVDYFIHVASLPSKEELERIERKRKMLSDSLRKGTKDFNATLKDWMKDPSNFDRNRNTAVVLSSSPTFLRDSRKSSSIADLPLSSSSPALVNTTALLSSSPASSPSSSSSSISAISTSLSAEYSTSSFASPTSSSRAAVVGRSQSTLAEGERAYTPRGDSTKASPHHHTNSAKSHRHHSKSHRSQSMKKKAHSDSETDTDSDSHPSRKARRKKWKEEAQAKEDDADTANDNGVSDDEDETTSPTSSAASSLSSSPSLASSSPVASSSSMPASPLSSSSSSSSPSSLQRKKHRTQTHNPALHRSASSGGSLTPSERKTLSLQNAPITRRYLNLAGSPDDSKEPKIIGGTQIVRPTTASINLSNNKASSSTASPFSSSSSFSSTSPIDDLEETRPEVCLDHLHFQFHKHRTDVGANLEQQGLLSERDALFRLLDNYPPPKVEMRDVRKEWERRLFGSSSPSAPSSLSSSGSSPSASTLLQLREDKNKNSRSHSLAEPEEVSKRIKAEKEKEKEREKEREKEEEKQHKKKEGKKGHRRSRSLSTQEGEVDGSSSSIHSHSGDEEKKRLSLGSLKTKYVSKKDEDDSTESEKKKKKKKIFVRNKSKDKDINKEVAASDKETDSLVIETLSSIEDKHNNKQRLKEAKRIIKELKDESIASDSRKRELEEENEQLRRKIQKLNDELKKEGDKLERNEKRIQRLVEEKERTEREKEQLSLQLQNEGKAQEKWGREKLQMVEEKENALKLVRELQRANQELEESIFQWKLKVKELVKEKMELKEEVAELNERMREWQKKRAKKVRSRLESLSHDDLNNIEDEEGEDDEEGKMKIPKKKRNKKMKKRRREKQKENHEGDEIHDELLASDSSYDSSSDGDDSSIRSDDDSSSKEENGEAKGDQDVEAKAKENGIESKRESRTVREQIAPFSLSDDDKDGDDEKDDDDASNELDRKKVDLPLTEIVLRMKAAVELRTHKHNLKRYKNCFRGLFIVLFELHNLVPLPVLVLLVPLLLRSSSSFFFVLSSFFFLLLLG